MIKKTLLCLAVFLVTFAIPYYSLFALLRSDRAIIEQQMEDSLDDSGAYRQRGSNGYYRVDVYETPKKEYGYTIVETLGDGTIVSTGYGPESDDRTYTISPKDIPFNKEALDLQL